MTVTAANDSNILGGNLLSHDLIKDDLNNDNEFLVRHIGPSQSEQQLMLKALGYKDLNSFTNAVVPESIRLKAELDLGSFQEPLSETQALTRLRGLADQNQVFRSYIGLGYYNCKVPAVIQRNILENPCWYTQYTPYQPEISQGRLEALLNYQTVVSELTGLPIANASLLDEATAAAEAMSVCLAVTNKYSSDNEDSELFLIDSDTHPQTITVVTSRAKALGLKVQVVDLSELTSKTNQALLDQAFGILLSYPGSSGRITDLTEIIKLAKSKSVSTVVACDLLALCLLKSPGELGADMTIGNAQRFGVPLGYGGPAAAFFAVQDEFKRLMPGRLIGLSKDSAGNPALRLALQTREQHIRRERATSNICTAQVLLANMSSMYAVYHGALGLKKIAGRVATLTALLAGALKQAGLQVINQNYFDTLLIDLNGQEQRGVVQNRAQTMKINLGWINDTQLRVALDETVELSDLEDLVFVLTGKKAGKKAAATQDHRSSNAIPANLKRTSSYLQQPVFNSYHSETEFLRYVRRLESKDLSLATAMIPLGSCTMKLNATSEMLPVSWPEIGNMHPFAPSEQTQGYSQIFADLEMLLARITGFSATSLQPNAGSQGEYAGLLVIKAYLENIGQGHRNICLIPKSAHGTNPASAVMAGFKVVTVDCDAAGNIDLQSLATRISENKSNLAALMATYPSTHGVFEADIQKACALVHEHGGQVYMDGANLNAIVGLSSSYNVGADVVHINLHKTFCIPHGGGGPGMGPICVREHLQDFLPGHPLTQCGGKKAIGAISAAPYGSASILPISWMYIAMMGASGLKTATQVAILSANYIAKKLSNYYPVLYTGPNGLVAHECIIDCRSFKQSAGIEVEDIAKRLIDYGFHAPTVSFPVPGTMMIEPTESESLAEVDRFCSALIAIHSEIEKIKNGEFPKDNNPLKNAPHTALAIMTDQWDRPYSRELAAYPTADQKAYKFWPACARVDGAYGDRNLICTCSVPLT